MSPLPQQIDIVGVGLNAFDTVIRLPAFPSFDSKMEIISSQSFPGGQTAGAIVACQRWGLRTRYIGKIGDDHAGRVHREEFRREGVESHLIEVPSCESQHSFILLDQSSGERTILWKRDPRLDISPSELRPEWITSARMLHVDGHPVAPSEAAARWARQADIPVIADLDNLYSGVEVLLEYVDFMISSREFPQRLLGVPDLTKSLPQISSRFGCRLACATLGRDGALAWDGAAFHYSPAFRITAVDTTGAGDVFHGAFAYAILQGEPLDRALEFSCAAAALNCAEPGARGGIRPVAEISALMLTGERHSRIFSEHELAGLSARARDAIHMGPANK